jgi:hypothetical protein
MTPRHLAAAAAGLLCIGLMPLTAAPAAATTNLIDAAPDTVAVPLPAPGHSAEATMDVRALRAGGVDLALRVVAVPDDALTGEGGPLTVQLEFDGTPVSGPTSLHALAADEFDLGRLADQDQHRLRAVVSMDRAAGNEYAGRSTSAVMRFIAQAADGSTAPQRTPASGELAFTGLGFHAAAVLGVAAAATAAGALLRRRRRTRLPQEEA